MALFFVSQYPSRKHGFFMRLARQSDHLFATEARDTVAAFANEIEERFS
jgi:hypothetical protein